MSNTESPDRDARTGESEEMVGFDDDLLTEEDEDEDEYDEDPMRDL